MCHFQQKLMGIIENCQYNCGFYFQLEVQVINKPTLAKSWEKGISEEDFCISAYIFYPNFHHELKYIDTPLYSASISVVG